MSLFKPEHMGVEEIIEKLQEAVDLGDSPHRGPFGTHVRKEYLVEAIDKLRTHPDTQPNEPLTEEELLEMDGEAVYKKACRGCTRHGDEIVSCYDEEPCEELQSEFVSAPAADVEPVRHGRWNGEGDGYAETEDGEMALVIDVWYCSECGYCIDEGIDDEMLLPNYCPNCGAKMDEEERK